jgi:hypothetical protein
MRRVFPSALAASAASALLLAFGVSGAPSASSDSCATQVFQNGPDLVFGSAGTQAAADRITQRAQSVGFDAVETVRASCSQWESVLRGIDSFDTAVGVQSEARRARLSPTVECVTAEEIGQLQAIFGTRPTLAELQTVIDRAHSFGYVGLKTKRAPCGGYQAYVAGFTSRDQALEFASTASQRTGLTVVIIKA